MACRVAGCQHGLSTVSGALLPSALLGGGPARRPGRQSDYSPAITSLPPQVQPENLQRDDARRGSIGGCWLQSMFHRTAGKFMPIIRPNRHAAVAATAAIAAGTAFAAVAVASPASATNLATTTARTSTWSWQTGWPGPAAGGWRPGAGPSMWPPSSAAHTAHFHVVLTKTSGPGP